MVDRSNTKDSLDERGTEKNIASEPSQETVAEKKEYQIDIFRDWCKSCGICTAFCPRACIELDDSGSPFVKDQALCSGCGWCEVHCPDFAISVRQRPRQTTQGKMD